MMNTGKKMKIQIRKLTQCARTFRASAKIEVQRQNSKDGCALVSLAYRVCALNA